MVIGSNQRLSFTGFWVLIVILSYSNGVAESQVVRGIFVFGDSLVDVGNNNYLSSIAKSNYYPYGVDFEYGPTGRFSNGKTFVDFIGKIMGLPYPLAFADPNTNGARLLGGVDYASAAAGILDETGQHYGQSFYYNPSQYANLLLNHYARQLLALYSVGLRKFFLAGIGPLGCIPNQRGSGQAPPGRCVDYVNQILGPFNEGLRSLVDQLNKRPGAMFVYGNTYGAVGDILNNPATFGFNVVDRACCGIGRNQGQITCLPFAMPCFNRNQYVFWDAFHPTEAVNAILARRAIYGSSADCYPINMLNMTLH
ncbi:GDSL esterase/lipase [Citrus sinensis]|nr:GDSL esterase/lipase [Citrus sinensis]